MLFKQMAPETPPPSPLNGKCHEKFPFSYPFPLTEKKQDPTLTLIRCFVLPFPVDTLEKKLK